MIKIKDESLKKAAQKSVSDFIFALYNAYMSEVGNDLSAKNMSTFNGEQHTLIAYCLFSNEIEEGGFCQLIQNGYGGYIFDNPFAKAMRLWGADELSKLIYRAKKIFDENREDLEKERTEEEFMAMYEQYEAFDEIEELITELKEKTDIIVAAYIDENISKFCEVEK